VVDLVEGPGGPALPHPLPILGKKKKSQKEKSWQGSKTKPPPPPNTHTLPQGLDMPLNLDS